MNTIAVPSHFLLRCGAGHIWFFVDTKVSQSKFHQETMLQQRVVEWFTVYWRTIDHRKYVNSSTIYCCANFLLEETKRDFIYISWIRPF